MTGCRCRPCTYANTEAVKVRDAEAKAAALALGPRTETHCVGVDGKPCPKGTKLRKDSSGNYCARCRMGLEWNGLVKATNARRHLRYLSRRGLGYRAVGDITDLAFSTLTEIVSHRRTQIRAETERLILEVDMSAAADGAYIDAAGTWTAIRRLIHSHGYTKARISKEIGHYSLGNPR